MFSFLKTIGQAFVKPIAVTTQQRKAAAAVASKKMPAKPLSMQTIYSSNPKQKLGLFTAANTEQASPTTSKALAPVAAASKALTHTAPKSSALAASSVIESSSPIASSPLDQVLQTKRYQPLFKQLAFTNPRVEHCTLLEGTLFVGLSKHSFNKQSSDRSVLVFPYNVKHHHKMWGTILLIADKEQSSVGLLRLSQDTQCIKLTSGEHNQDVIYMVDDRNRVLRQGVKLYPTSSRAEPMHSSRLMSANKSAVIGADTHFSADPDSLISNPRYR